MLGIDGKFLAQSSGCEACETAVKLARKWGYLWMGKIVNLTIKNRVQMSISR